ncbi:MAG: sensor histidine kinase response regulator [Polyangiaceae bacterium]|nr:sensor histidine kinase response regulator [Polyangiaceae bacterium]
MSDPSQDELERLRGIEERHRLLFTNMGAAFALYQMIADADGKVVDARLLEVNPAYSRMIGRPDEELVGQTIREITPYFDERWLSFLARVASTGKPDTRTDYVPAHDRYVDVRAYCPLPGQAAIQLYDVTEQKRAEQTIRERDARLDALVTSAMDAIVSLDDAQRITLFNPAAEKMFRCSAAEALGSDFADLISPQHREAQREQISDFVQSGLASRRMGMVGELRGVRSNGEEFPLEASISQCTVQKRQLITLILRDASERRRAEDDRLKFLSQIQQTQKLESLGVLAGGIAHDFNNLLMAVLGHADLALDALPRSSEAREDLAEIRRAAQRATELCKQMLAYSGKGRFVIQAVELQKVVEEMLHMLRVSISKNAILKLSFAPNLPSVDADASQLRQVIMNLVINASEAIGERSGVITLCTGAMDCDRGYLSEAWLDEQLPEGMYVFIEVADTGSGMDAETRSRIFDPFFTTKFTGRGLGLAAVLGIVRGHRGAIKIYSEPGRGTTLKVLFPVSQRAPEREEGSLVRGIYEGRGTVLLVDDDESVRAVGRKMLERIGFAVVTAADGAEAIARFRERADDIICAIVDLTMPHVDGAETFRELRRMRPGVRVILSSGYNEQDVTQRFVGKGLAGFIQKPYQLSTLVSVLQEVLAKARE